MTHDILPGTGILQIGVDYDLGDNVNPFGSPLFKHWLKCKFLTEDNLTHALESVATHFHLVQTNTVITHSFAHVTKLAYTEWLLANKEHFVCKPY